MAFVSSAFERKIIPLRDERGALFIPDRNYGHHEISRGRRGRSRRILPSRPDCLNGISKICWKIDSRANVPRDGVRTAGFDRGCAKNAQEPTRRRIVFSIALTAATALFVSTLTKSRRTFY